MTEGNRSININISTKTIVYVTIIVLLILVARRLSTLIFSILTSIVIASFVGSAAHKFKRYIKNRTLAIFIIYILTIAIFMGLSSVFIPIFVNEMSSLVTQLSNYIPNSSILNTFQPDTISGAKDVVGNISENASLVDVVKSTKSLIDTFSGGLVDIASKAFGGIFYLIVTIIVSFYLSITENGIESFLRIIIPGKQEEYIVNLWKRAEHKIGLWMQGQMLVGLIIGVLSYLGLTIIGVKFSFVLAIITAFCLLIPFGIFLALPLATMFAYLNGGLTIATLTVFFYLVLQQFESYLISPLIVKKVTGVSSLVVILAVLIGAELAGVWGVILAVPGAVVLFEIFDDIEKKKILVKNN
jgi:predicted PurR-regulated permease PerM